VLFWPCCLQSYSLALLYIRKGKNIFLFECNVTALFVIFSLLFRWCFAVPVVVMAASKVKQTSSVAEPHQFYAAPAPGKNFDAAPAAPAPTLLYSKAKFLK
jgi:hypothetical protein